MPIPSSITDLDISESMNSPSGSDPIGGTLDNYLRSHAAIIKKQFSKGASISSASTTTVPPDFSCASVVKVVSTINAFTDNFNGRIAYLKFEAGITIAHSASIIMPAGVSVVTQANDIAVFVNESAGVWRCLSYPRYVAANHPGAEPTITHPYMMWADTANARLMRRNADNTAWVDLGPLLEEGVDAENAKWLSTPVGWIREGEFMEGADTPPTDDPRFRYILLTAGQTGAGKYNEGVLTNESVSGTSPNVVATAIISLAGSPFVGKTINLINSEERYLRPGVKGRLQGSAYGSHSHTGTALSAGAHFHGAANLGGSGGSVGSSSPVAVGIITSTNGEHTHTLSINSSGDTETRTKNAGVLAYLRIL